MRGRGWIAIALVSAAVAAWPVSPAEAEIGGPPTNDFDRCDSYSKPCGEPLVLAEGWLANGPREVVGLDSRIGTCLFFESLSPQFGFGTCDESVNPKPAEPLRIELISRSHLPGEGATTGIGGVLRPDVAAVRVRYPRHGKRHVVEAITNQLDPGLAKAVGGNGRFGVFDFACRGKVRFGRFRVQAYDADGRLLAVERSPFGGASAARATRLGKAARRA
jgi:hypothetical protein